MSNSDQPNPYQAPEATLVSPNEQQPQTAPPLLAQFKQVFIEWEKLRIVYIVVCALVSIVGLFAFGIGISNFDAWTEIIFFGLIANFFYFAGPVCESYLSFLGVKTKPLRLIAFTLGTVFTCVVAFFAIYDISTRI